MGQTLRWRHKVGGHLSFVVMVLGLRVDSTREGSIKTKLWTSPVYITQLNKL